MILQRNVFWCLFYRKQEKLTSWLYAETRSRQWKTPIYISMFLTWRDNHYFSEYDWALVICPSGFESKCWPVNVYSVYTYIIYTHTLSLFYIGPPNHHKKRLKIVALGDFLPFSICLVLYFLFVYMNTSWAPHLEMSPKGFTMATIQRYSQLPSRPTAL